MVQPLRTSQIRRTKAIKETYIYIYYLHLIFYLSFTSALMILIGIYAALLALAASENEARFIQTVLVVYHPRENGFFLHSNPAWSIKFCTWYYVNGETQLKSKPASAFIAYRSFFSSCSLLL